MNLSRRNTRNSQKNLVITGSPGEVDYKQTKEKVSKMEKAEELQGQLSKQQEENKLMSSVMENDKDAVDDGKLLSEGINQNLSSFVPDMMFKNMVKDFKLTRNLYGDFIIRKLTGYDPGFIEKNIKIPEFKEELAKKIEENVKKLKEKDLVNKEGEITNKGVTLSALTMLTEELDRLKLKGLGERKDKKKDIYGEKEDYTAFRKTRYRDIAVKQSVKTALRRGHTEMMKEDLRIYERKKKGGISIIYALDTSGSMKGEKIRMGKQAGIALAYRAISEKNKVGLIVFNEEVKGYVEPTLDFQQILMSLVNLKTKAETDFAQAIDKAIQIFGNTHETKHLILLTDALPTKGENPEKETIKAVSMARDLGITISLIGINLDADGLKLSKKIIEISEGRLYRVKNVDTIDQVILDEYYHL
jgi:Mg-chelatase subunit ChlD